jgi:uncharacterized protein (DUF2336 family)
MKEQIDYEEAKRLLQDGDPEVRRALAERHDVQPEILYYLAEDDVPDVRLAIASNRTTPRQADLILSNDPDDDIRINLAEKVSSIIPENLAFGEGKLHKITSEILRNLAKDQATRVRAALSDAIKGNPDIPRDIVNTLARDVELVVSQPVLTHSPVLTESDLIEIIESSPVQGAIKAIAHRYNVSEGVSHAIASTKDIDAVTTLLNNDSAQIREDTLDQILDQAPVVTQWQKPLATRTKLPRAAAQRLANFVSSALFETLVSRNDLDAETAQELSTIVESRLNSEEPMELPDVDENDQDIIIEIKDLVKNDGLTEDVMLKALVNGRKRFLAIALAKKSGLPIALIEDILSSQSARGIVSMAWKADFTMRLAVQLQLRLGRIDPSEVLKPKSKNRWPMTENEMAWQLEFFFSKLEDKKVLHS